jgi:vacuolar-type H+-ATPase subunit E/Vma4
MTTTASTAAPATSKGLEDHAERVRSKGRQEAERILAEARSEAAELIQRAEAEVRAAEGRARSEAEVEARTLEQHEMSSAELDSKRKRLLAQKQVLDQVAASALHRLAELPEEKRRTLVGALLARAKQDIPAGGARCNERDRPQVEGAGYRYLGPLAGAGGIVVESADGLFRVDLRYETVLQETWGRSVKDVVTALNQGP